MARPPLADAFAHHIWATGRLLDACSALSAEQLEATTDGTYGSIIETFRHLAASDRGYLGVMSGGGMPYVDDETMDSARIREVIEQDGEQWQRVVARMEDPDRIYIGDRIDGSVNRSPAGIRLAQALHHGTDHRSQICTILTTLGIEPPEIDVWEYGRHNDRVEEVSAPNPA